MTAFQIEITVPTEGQEGVLMAPQGLDMPGIRCVGLNVAGAFPGSATEANTSQGFVVAIPQGSEVVFTYHYESAETAYPDGMFQAP